MDFKRYYARSDKRINTNTTLTSLGVPSGGKISILGYEFVNQGGTTMTTLVNAISLGDDQIPGASPSAEDTFLAPYHTISFTGDDGVDVAAGKDGYFYLYFNDPPTDEELASLPREIFGATPLVGDTTGHTMLYIPKSMLSYNEPDRTTFSKPKYGTVKFLPNGYLYIPTVKDQYPPDYFTYRSLNPDAHYVKLFYISINGGGF
jgi:hypothetical protein